jgi:hypothetical protein
LENIKKDIKGRLNKFSELTGITDTEVLFATLLFRTTQTTKKLRSVENSKLVANNDLDQNDLTDTAKKAKSGMNIL